MSLLTLAAGFQSIFLSSLTLLGKASFSSLGNKLAG